MDAARQTVLLLSHLLLPGDRARISTQIYWVIIANKHIAIGFSLELVTCFDMFILCTCTHFSAKYNIHVCTTKCFYECSRVLSGRRFYCVFVLSTVTCLRGLLWVFCHGLLPSKVCPLMF